MEPSNDEAEATPLVAAQHDGSMRPPRTSSHRVGRPPRTSRAEILAAARLLVDRDGWDKLTIRQLAAELGVGATTLYHHVADKEDLLVQLLNHYAEQIERPDLPDDPKQRIIAAASVMHDGIAAWPGLADLLIADDVLGESALWMVDGIVGGAIDCGCTHAQAVYVYRTIWYYTAGEILIHAHIARRRKLGDRPTYNERVFGDLDAERLPNLAAIGDEWSTLNVQDTYDRGLRALVDGLLVQCGVGDGR